MDRLMRKLEQLVDSGVLTDRVVAQTGYCTYLPANIECRRFFDKNEMEKNIKECSLLICHGGTGSIISGSRCGKKIIVVPRRKEYGEHVDDHQLEIAEAFLQGGHVLVAQDPDDLEQVIHQSEGWVPIPYRSNSDNFAKLVLENL